MSNGPTAIPVSPVDFITMLQDLTNKAALVPTLQAENARLERERNEAQDHNQKLELSIRNYRDQIDALNAKVRSLVVERDDASFRELETADRLAELLKVMGNLRSSISDSMDRANPPKADSAPVMGQSEASPIVTGQSGATGANESQSASLKAAEDTAVALSHASQEGQRDLSPTASSAPASHQSPASSSEPASGDGALDQPYAGQEWWKRPTGMPVEEWIAKGGQA